MKLRQNPSLVSSQRLLILSPTRNSQRSYQRFSPPEFETLSISSLKSLISASLSRRTLGEFRFSSVFFFSILVIRLFRVVILLARVGGSLPISITSAKPTIA